MTRRYFVRAAAFVPALLVFFAAFVSAPANAADAVSGGVSGITDGEFIVRLKSENVPSSLPGTLLRRVDSRTVVMRLGNFENASGNTLQRYSSGNASPLEALRGNGNVLFAEPNYLGYFAALPPVPVPNDPAFGQQWWLPAVGAQSLWAINSGQGSIVAVVDSGVDVRHPDLAPNIVAGGYDFGDDDDDPSDSFGHGTAVAGVLAAACGNGAGGCGLAPRAGILPLKINPGGSSTFHSDRLARAVRYAADHGARVINLSVYVTQETELVREAIRYALDRGVIVVAAAGNDHGGPVAFPANMSGVIAVAASSRDGGLLASSNDGPEIAVAAPGDEIYSTAPNGAYGVFTGTSMATPMVSATLAAMTSASPFLPTRTLTALLAQSARPLNGTPDKGYGIVDAGKSAGLLLPRLIPGKTQYRTNEAAEVSYTLPPVVHKVDLYVAAATPEGEFSLTADGGWHAVAQSGYLPLVRDFPLGGENNNGNTAPAMSGTLFGDDGIYPALPLSGLPPGAYSWRIALVAHDEQGNARLIGAINSDAMQVLP